MPRPRSRGFGTRVAKRQTSWIGPADLGYVDVATGATVIVAFFDPATNGLPKPTIVRTRGEVTVRPATGVFADIEVTGAFGLAVVSDQAFAAGAASVPAPFSEASWDGWFVWRSFSFALEAGDATGLTRVSFEQEVDSKAMRKVTENETIILVAESQGGAFRINMPLRLLLKLS